MNEPRYCAQCRYYRGAHLSTAPSTWCTCTHPSALGNRDIVTGNQSPASCWDMRAIDGKCGPEARLFSPRPTLTERLLERLR